VRSVISSEEDVNIKIAEAEDYILDAEDKEALGEYKEALILSQKAKKIVEQIEAYRKIKEAEEKESEKAAKKESRETPVEEPVEEEVVEEVPTEEVSVEEPSELTEEELRAQVIKSIEETKSKLNLNLSTQTLLQ
jgi:uncharacterized protein YaaW (UPF0174 family)